MESKGKSAKRYIGPCLSVMLFGRHQWYSIVLYRAYLLGRNVEGDGSQIHFTITVHAWQDEKNPRTPSTASSKPTKAKYHCPFVFLNYLYTGSIMQWGSGNLKIFYPLTLKQKNSENGIVTMSSITDPTVATNSTTPMVFGFSATAAANELFCIRDVFTLDSRDTLSTVCKQQGLPRSNRKQIRTWYVCSNVFIFSDAG